MTPCAPQPRRQASSREMEDNSCLYQHQRSCSPCLGFPACGTDCCPVVGTHCPCAQGGWVSRAHLHAMIKTPALAEVRSKEAKVPWFSRQYSH